MERLTRKENGFYIREVELLDYYEVIDIVKGKCIWVKENKLGEFEDFMEEQGFESLEDLKKTIANIENLMLISSKITDIQQENQSLKDRWEKLKEFVRVGAKYYIFNNGVNFVLPEDILVKMRELEKGGNNNE